MTKVESKIRSIIAEQLNIDEEDVKAEASLLDDLGADSLDITEVMMSFEEEFDIEISDEDLAKVRTVQDITTYINERVS